MQLKIKILPFYKNKVHKQMKGHTQALEEITITFFPRQNNLLYTFQEWQLTD